MNYDSSEYELLHIITMDVKPEFDIEEDGSYFYYLSDAHRVFLNRKDKIKFPFTYKDYIRNEDIIDTLKGYEIDIEKFWLAILFIYDITQEKCVNVLSLGETAKVQIENLKKFLSGITSFTITANSKKKLVINEPLLINQLKSHLEMLLDDESYNLEVTSIPIMQPSNYLHSTSVQMWYAANRFIELFKSLKLPTKRSKNVSKEHKEIYSEQVKRRTNIKTVYFNKMLLISQLMYLMKFTKNKSFLLDENALKGILKQYKNYKLNTFSKVYFV